MNEKNEKTDERDLKDMQNKKIKEVLLEIKKLRDSKYDKDREAFLKMNRQIEKMVNDQIRDLENINSLDDIYEKFNDVDKYFSGPVRFRMKKVVFKRGTEIATENLSIWRNYAYYCLFDGDPNEALIAYNIALRLAENQEDIKMIERGISLAFSLLGNYEKAIEKYRSITDQWPDFYLGWSGLAYSYFKLGDFSNSENIYEVSLEKPPEIEYSIGDKGSDIFFYSQVLFQLGNFEKSYDELTFSLDLNNMYWASIGLPMRSVVYNNIANWNIINASYFGLFKLGIELALEELLVENSKLHLVEERTIDAISHFLKLWNNFLPDKDFINDIDEIRGIWFLDIKYNLLNYLLGLYSISKISKNNELIINFEILKQIDEKKNLKIYKEFKWISVFLQLLNDAIIFFSLWTKKNSEIREKLNVFQNFKNKIEKYKISRVSSYFIELIEHILKIIHNKIEPSQKNEALFKRIFYKAALVFSDIVDLEWLGPVLRDAPKEKIGPYDIGTRIVSRGDARDFLELIRWFSISNLQKKLDKIITIEKKDLKTIETIPIEIRKKESKLFDKLLEDMSKMHLIQIDDKQLFNQSSYQSFFLLNDDDISTIEEFNQKCEIQDKIENFDIVTWALKIKEEEKKGTNALVWIRPRRGQGNGRLSNTFIELVIFNLLPPDQRRKLKSNSERQLIKSITIHGESKEPLGYSKKPKEVDEFWPIPLKNDLDVIIPKDMKFPKRLLNSYLVEETGMGYKSVAGRTGRVKISLLENRGLIIYNEIEECYELTKIGKIAIESIWQSLIIEFALSSAQCPLNYEEIKKLPPLARFIIQYYRHENFTKEGIAENIGIDTSFIDPFLKKALSFFNVKKWKWSKNFLIIDEEDELSAFINVSTREELWTKLMPGKVIPSAYKNKEESESNYELKFFEERIKEANYSLIDKEKMIKKIQSIENHLKFLQEYENFQPVDGLLNDIIPEIYELEDKEIIGPKYSFTLLRGPVGIGKTVLIGQIAIKWLEQGKNVYFLNLIGKIPGRCPFGPRNLIIIDNIEYLPNENLIKIAQWINELNCFIVATTHSETWNSRLNELQEEQNWPKKMPLGFREIELRDWTFEELDELLTHISKVTGVNIPEHLKSKIIDKADGNPCWLVELIKIGGELKIKSIEDSDLDAVTSVMAAKQIRVLAHTLTTPDGSWKYPFVKIFITTLGMLGYFSINHILPKKIFTKLINNLMKLENFDENDNILDLIDGFIKNVTYKFLFNDILDDNFILFLKSDEKKYSDWLDTLKLIKLNHWTLSLACNITFKNSNRIDRFPLDEIPNIEGMPIFYPKLKALRQVGLEDSKEEDRWLKVYREWNAILFNDEDIERKIQILINTIKDEIKTSKHGSLLWQAVIVSVPYFQCRQLFYDFRSLFPDNTWHEENLRLWIPKLNIDEQWGTVSAILKAIDLIIHRADLMPVADKFGLGELLYNVSKYIDDELGDLKLALYNNAGHLFERIEKRDRAISIMKEAENFAEKNALIDNTFYFQNITLLISLLQSIGNLAEAEQFIKKAEKFKEGKIEIIDKIQIIYQKGLIALKQEKIEDSRKYFQEIIDISNENKELIEKNNLLKIQILASKFRISQFLIESKNFQNVNLYFEEIINSELLIQLITKITYDEFLITLKNANLSNEILEKFRKKIEEFSLQEIKSIEIDPKFTKFQKIEEVFRVLIYFKKFSDAFNYINKKIDEEDFQLNEKIHLLELRARISIVLKKIEIAINDFEAILDYLKDKNEKLREGDVLRELFEICIKLNDFEKACRCLVDYYIINLNYDENTAINTQRILEEIMNDNHISKIVSRRGEGSLKNNKIIITSF